MMSFEEQAALVRCLRGAASSILWMLLLSDESLTAVQLQEATGYSDKPVSQALARLKALGLVAHHGRAQGWRVSRSNWQEVTGSVAGGRGELSEHNYSTGGGPAAVRAELKEDSAVLSRGSMIRSRMSGDQIQQVSHWKMSWPRRWRWQDLG